ncbi:transketolase [Candidatus Woesearchaeota archaeon CG10_big_fil_rev_8_21_14_0_10_45_16]|nr:MAG: transketolase [Candidatus Woesearchaeota archaeon CG10_big_fil_rev_8_21_14_0_10_45_16]
MKKLTKIKDLQMMADVIREDTIAALTEAKSGHSGGPLGMADIFTALYFNILKHNPKKPCWEGRDRLVLSNGHICPILYSTMANAGYFPKEELFTLRKLGTRLQGHPHREALPGLETTSGPLGSGLSQASGMAYGLRLDKKKNIVFCLCSDGEQNEGNHWEAVLFAAKNKLSNLIAITDRNYIQIDGNTEEIMPLDPLDQKYKAFNWNVEVIDGHDFRQILHVLKKARNNKGKPLMIIANTIPGKGVEYMENDYRWHGSPPGTVTTERTPPKDEQTDVALEEIHAHEAEERGDWYLEHLRLRPIHTMKRKQK